SAVIPGLPSPPRARLTTPRRTALHTPRGPAEADRHCPEPWLSHPAAKRFPYSELRGVAAGLLEHRLQVRLRELQSIMVWLAALRIVLKKPTEFTRYSLGGIIAGSVVIKSRKFNMPRVRNRLGQSA